MSTLPVITLPVIALPVIALPVITFITKVYILRVITSIVHVYIPCEKLNNYAYIACVCHNNLNIHCP